MSSDVESDSSGKNGITAAPPPISIKDAQDKSLPQFLGTRKRTETECTQNLATPAMSEEHAIATGTSDVILQNSSPNRLSFRHNQPAKRDSENNPSKIRTTTSRIGKRIPTWGFALITLFIIAITFIYLFALTLSGGALTRLIPATDSNALLCLKIVTEVTAFCLTALTALTLESLLWSLADQKPGIFAPSLLAMSPTTGPLGLGKLLGWRNQENGHLVWAVSRYSRFDVS